MPRFGTHFAHCSTLAAPRCILTAALRLAEQKLAKSGRFVRTRSSLRLRRATEDDLRGGRRVWPLPRCRRRCRTSIRGRPEISEILRHRYTRTGDAYCTVARQCLQLQRQRHEPHACGNTVLDCYSVCTDVQNFIYSCGFHSISQGGTRFSSSGGMICLNSRSSVRFSSSRSTYSRGLSGSISHAFSKSMSRSSPNPNFMMCLTPMSPWTTLTEYRRSYRDTMSTLTSAGLTISEISQRTYQNHRHTPIGRRWLVRRPPGS